jgi:hypothetical protein
LAEVLPEGTEGQRKALSERAAGALAGIGAHNAKGVSFASKSIAKPNVYTPAAWCDACRAIASGNIATGTVAVAALALPEPVPAVAE